MSSHLHRCLSICGHHVRWIAGQKRLWDCGHRFGNIGTFRQLLWSLPHGRLGRWIVEEHSAISCPHDTPRRATDWSTRHGLTLIYRQCPHDSLCPVPLCLFSCCQSGRLIPLVLDLSLLNLCCQYLLHPGCTWRYHCGRWSKLRRHNRRLVVVMVQVHWRVLHQGDCFGHLLAVHRSHSTRFQLHQGLGFLPNTLSLGGVVIEAGKRRITSLEEGRRGRRR